MTDLSAPCGLFCGACPLYKAEHDPEFRNSLAEKMKVPPNRARCPGCRPASGNVTPIDGQCQTYVCSESKKLDFCYRCNDFPCNKLAPCSDRANILPHNFKLFSLLTLKNVGREAWEKEYPLISRKYFRGKLLLGGGPQV